MIKQIMAWLHLWLGLITGIIVFILSVTGAILVFEQELKPIVYSWQRAPRPSMAEYVPPSQLYRTAQTVVPDKHIISVWYHGHGKAAHVSLESDSVLWVNPYTGAAQALVDHDDFFHIMKDGHVYLWLPPQIGQQVTVWSTLIFFLLLVTGIVLWWPKRWNRVEKNKAFKIKWNAKWKRLNYDLHNVLGFYSLILALVFAFTALMMGFGWLRSTVYWTLSGGGERVRVSRAAVHSDTTVVSSMNFLQKSDVAFMKGMGEIAAFNKDQIIVSFPHKPQDNIYVCTDMYKGDWRDVYLDQNTFETLPSSAARRDQLKAADWMMRNNYGLHVGETGGMFTKILYFLGCAVCASLPLTGFIVWWQKGKKLTP